VNQPLQCSISLNRLASSKISSGISGSWVSWYSRANASTFALSLGGSLRKVWPSISARAENRCDDGGCIRRSLSRISLFFCLRDRPESVGDRTPYRQQTLSSSCLPWSYPHRALVSMGNVGYALCPHPVLMTRGAEREPGPIVQLYAPISWNLAAVFGL
jgi:hypothetical protein